jgi:hypothetical protein
MSKQILIRVKTAATVRETDDAPPVLDSIRQTWWPEEK